MFDAVIRSPGLDQPGERSQHQAGERSSRAMTIKEKLEIHKQIVESNERKLKEWKERRKSA